MIAVLCLAFPLLPLDAGAVTTPTTLRAQVLERSMQPGGELLIVLDKGTSKGVAVGWTGRLYTNKARTGAPSAAFVVVRVTANEAIASVSKPPVGAFPGYATLVAP
jgi:hypothetical protein